MDLQAYPGDLKTLLLDFLSLEDHDLRAQFLIDYGERFREVPTKIASRPYPEENKVPACESEAYLFTEPRGDGTLNFYFAVENPQGISARALAVILCSTLSGLPRSEVSQIPEDIVYILFGRSISMGKGQGLIGMVRMLRNAAKGSISPCLMCTTKVS